ncbi:hypothetical protein M0R72_01250 [Candidatus Pacearchaeota archaeon]|jgi:hypothetical protein|nr:hypothetical protein [Candidatus Pacearchaeota archaeon]
MEPEEPKVELNVDGMHDPNHDITYIGKATKMEDGTWRCLANVEGALCLVEVNIRPSKEDLRASVFCCSFCGKSSAECEILIAGPMVNICNECIELAQDCVDDQRAKKTEGNSPVSFVGHIKSDSPCETCRNCIPPFNSVAPWWKGSCTEGLGLKTKVKTCPLYIEAEWKKPFVPPLGEFSGCRCPDCPEREGTGECSCCAERRDEEKNPGPDPFV